MIHYMILYTVCFIVVLSVIGIWKVGLKQFLKNFF